MLQSSPHHLLPSHFSPRSTFSPLPASSSPCLFFLHRPLLSLSSLSSHQLPSSQCHCLPLFQDSISAVAAADGPVELPPASDSSSIFATTSEPSTLQVATSVLLTGAITVFLFRSLRRRAKRAKELKFRSTGAKKSIKEEAMESLKAMTPTSVDAAKSPPSAMQALLGGISAGVIALILYKFTTTIEDSLNRQTLSDNLSVSNSSVDAAKLVG